LPLPGIVVVVCVCVCVCVCAFFSLLVGRWNPTSFVFEGLGFGWLVGGPKCVVAFVMRAELPNPS
jgi:hypothetical protein